MTMRLHLRRGAGEGGRGREGNDIIKSIVINCLMHCLYIAGQSWAGALCAVSVPPPAANHSSGQVPDVDTAQLAARGARIYSGYTVLVITIVQCWGLRNT